MLHRAPGVLTREEAVPWRCEEGVCQRLWFRCVPGSTCSTLHPALCHESQAAGCGNVHVCVLAYKPLTHSDVISDGSSGGGGGVPGRSCSLHSFSAVWAWVMAPPPPVAGRLTSAPCRCLRLNLDAPNPLTPLPGCGSVQHGGAAAAPEGALRQDAGERR